MRYALVALVVVISSACALADPPGLAAYNEGVQHQQKGEAGQAQQEFKIALQQQPEMAEAHINLGLLYLNDGWLDGAEAETRQAIDILERTKTTLVRGSTYKQTLSLGYSNLGAIRFTRAQQALLKLDLAQAETFTSQGTANLNTAIQLDPTNAKAQSVLAALKNR